MKNYKTISNYDKGKELRHSRPLDVHVWSEHIEVSGFVNSIFATYFKGSGSIKKKHLKVVLLDLFVAWKVDPELKIHYSRNVNSYLPKTRYNSLSISKLTIEVMNKLEQIGFVEQRKGFQDRVTGSSFQTRVWPTPKLIALFSEATFGTEDIEQHKDRETIILKDDQNKKIEYDDQNRTHSMRQVLKAYNELLTNTFIDIPSLEERRVSLTPLPQNQESFLYVDQNDHFTRRVFNRGSFDKGGRFYGGWWQRCPKDLRQKIYINDEPTIELDFIGLHVQLLYAREGVEYLATGKDPYDLSAPDWWPEGVNLRKTVKTLAFVAINASEEKAAFKAFRKDSANGSKEKGLKDAQLLELLDLLKSEHPAIAKYFGSDAGIDLMNVDSMITENIIRKMTSNAVPVLSIHDSYIAPLKNMQDLWIAMVEAYEAVTGMKLTRRNLEIDTKGTGLKGKEFCDELLTINFSRLKTTKTVEDAMFPIPSERYLSALEEHRALSSEQNLLVA